MSTETNLKTDFGFAVKKDKHGMYWMLNGSYIGDQKHIDFLHKRGIIPEPADPEKTCCIGWCKREQKWYGWSHRAIYGFGVGSICKKGNCGYVANNPEEMIDDYANFFSDISDECAQQHREQCAVLPDRSGIIINHRPLMIPMIESMNDLEAALEDSSNLPEIDIFDGDYTIQKCGRGEWIAETLKDAKQMAIDFAESIA